jgi:hypothetical protein
MLVIIKLLFSTCTAHPRRRGYHRRPRMAYSSRHLAVPAPWFLSRPASHRTAPHRNPFHQAADRGPRTNFLGTSLHRRKKRFSRATKKGVMLLSESAPSLFLLGALQWPLPPPSDFRFVHPQVPDSNFRHREQGSSRHITEETANATSRKAALHDITRRRIPTRPRRAKAENGRLYIFMSRSSLQCSISTISLQVLLSPFKPLLYRLISLSSISIQGKISSNP